MVSETENADDTSTIEYSSFMVREGKIDRNNQHGFHFNNFFSVQEIETEQK